MEGDFLRRSASLIEAKVKDRKDPNTTKSVSSSVIRFALWDFDLVTFVTQGFFIRRAD